MAVTAATRGQLRSSVTWVIPVAAVFGVATALVIPLTTRWATTYSGTSLATMVADLAGGLGLMAVGSGLLVQGQRRDAGVIALLAGVAWLSPDWIGWQGGIGLVRTVGMLAALFYLPLILHLVALYPRRSPRDRIQGDAVAVAYVTIAIISLAAVLFRDPLADPHCWNNCTDDVLLISNQPGVGDALAIAAPTAALAVGLAVVLLGAQRLARATRGERRMIAPVILPALLVGAAGAAHATLLLALTREGPQIAIFSVLFQVRAWLACLLALGLVWTIVRARRSQNAVLRLAKDLGDAPRPGAVAPALAQAMGDPTLDVAYWLPHTGRYVDGTGHAMPAPVPNARRAVTRIVRGGRTVGVVTHDAAIDSSILDGAMGAAARLALENERLRVELLAQLEDLRASRGRIVSAGDAERARLERDLHDGAQQRLLSLVYELQQARNGDSGDLLGKAVRETEAIIDELREVAHGIYPATLAENGLQAGLLALADRAPIPVEVTEVPAGRFPQRAEQTAYATAARALESATANGADFLAVRVRQVGDELLVEVDGAGPGPFPDIADRVGSAGGKVTADSTTLRAWIPCG